MADPYWSKAPFSAFVGKMRSDPGIAGDAYKNSPERLAFVKALFERAGLEPRMLDKTSPFFSGYPALELQKNGTIKVEHLQDKMPATDKSPAKSSYVVWTIGKDFSVTGARRIDTEQKGKATPVPLHPGLTPN